MIITLFHVLTSPILAPYKNVYITWFYLTTFLGKGQLFEFALLFNVILIDSKFIELIDFSENFI